MDLQIWFKILKNNTVTTIGTVKMDTRSIASVNMMVKSVGLPWTNFLEIIHFTIHSSAPLSSRTVAIIKNGINTATKILPQIPVKVATPS